MKPVGHKRLQAQEQSQKNTRTHYLWWDKGESLQDVRKRFQKKVEEGRASESDDYIIFRWKW
jgi:broad specificity phosphatase PhoE